MTDISVNQSQDVKKSFKDKMSDLLEDMWEKIGQHHHGLYATPGKMGKPDADLSESGDVLTYKLELPGMSEQDIDVEITDGMLTVKGEKRDESEEKGDNYIFTERRYGSFERRFLVPANVDAKHVKANFDKGVLKITVPYRADAEKPAEKIPVETE